MGGRISIFFVHNKSRWLTSNANGMKSIRFWLLFAHYAFDCISQCHTLNDPPLGFDCFKLADWNQTQTKWHVFDTERLNFDGIHESDDVCVGAAVIVLSHFLHRNPKISSIAWASCFGVGFSLQNERELVVGVWLKQQTEPNGITSDHKGCTKHKSIKAYPIERAQRSKNIIHSYVQHKFVSHEYLTPNGTTQTPICHRASTSRRIDDVECVDENIDTTATSVVWWH